MTASAQRPAEEPLTSALLEEPPSVVVVLPTYNEVDNVAMTVEAVLTARCRPDVLVVDDSSPDGTAAVVERVAAAWGGRVRLLVRPDKQGLGAAYLSAFRDVIEAGPYDVVVQMDVDGSHDPADVDRLVHALRHADLAIGSRYLSAGDVTGWSISRRLLSRAGNHYARLVSGARVHDLTGGFKAWRTSLLRALVDTDVDAAGYGFQIEMTLRALRHGARVVELPIVFRDRQMGESKMSGLIAAEALLLVPRLRYRLRKPTPNPFQRFDAEPVTAQQCSTT